ncbi:transporter [Mangrovimicrobium sediminis]|uniref:Transporter n=1 Tax=Mangrovimicrobium sediminis TaxID=2562682 RepID=A0A4Z0LW82_9GAMM|nr:TolC family protein [Haliea sp. SAOS-164]TGD71519.1 transporter [Haliea sp. SAOS-164]
MKKFLVLALLCLQGVAVQARDNPAALTLASAVAAATAGDPWLAGSEFREQALADEAVAAASLPDPRLSLAAGNFPTDTWDINQEAMTQLSVGVSQMFPRGDSLALQRQQKEQLSTQEPLLRRDRSARIAAQVARLWLSVYRAQEAIHLIEQDRVLFEYLVDAARASYTSAMGHTRQQDLVRARLELTRLEDRLAALRLEQEAGQRQLAQWIGPAALQPLAQGMPPLETALSREALRVATASEQQAYTLLQQHPALAAMDRRIEATTTGVDLARQSYKPEWGINATYGYRDDDTFGEDRADLFSVGVTVDLPLFTGNRQDRQVGAAVARAEALKTERQLLVRRLVADLRAGVARLQRLDERSELYAGQLLPQMAQQAEAALSAYNNDDGDFAEAVRARIAELDAKIESLSLAVERGRAIADINYLLAGNASAADQEGEAQ